jgi:hypothetical protein
MVEDMNPDNQHDRPESDISDNSSGENTQHQPSNTNSNANQTKTHSREWRMIWERIEKKVELLFIGVSAFATVSYTIISCNQLSQMGAANKISRDGLVKVQSAFVIVNPVPEIQTTTSDTGQQDAWFNFSMENTGTTPAINLKAHINTLTGSGPLPTEFAFPDAPDVGGTRDDGIPIIGPKATVPLIGHMTREKLERFYRHEIRLYFYGWVTYNDIFDKTPLHASRFSYEVISIGTARLANGQEGRGLQTIFTGPRHNCYNQQCDEKERQ